MCMSQAIESRLINDVVVFWPQVAVSLCPVTSQSSDESQLMLHGFQLRKSRSSSGLLTFHRCPGLEDLRTEACQFLLQCGHFQQGMFRELLLLGLRDRRPGCLLFIRPRVSELLSEDQHLFLLFLQVSQLFPEGNNLQMRGGG